MTFDNLIFTREDHICTIKINNPTTLNALNSSTLKELGEAADMIKADKSIYVLIITGEGRSFVAGADITEMKSLNSEEGKRFGLMGAEVFRKIESLPIPVIAAVNGFALGGGCELALACDIRLASVNAKFGQPEVSLGITPGFSGTVRLSKTVGIGKAKEMIFTGGVINAEEALKIGLVNRVIEHEKLIEEAIKLAVTICDKAPIAVKYSKEAINRASECDTDTAVMIESSLFGLCFATDDQKEGMGAFLEKRKPEFKNR